jgi:energy-coupling factor transporter transmembrane protein EcfT
MNNKYPSNSKVCATCNFWQGQRNFTSTLRNLVEVVPGTFGDCLEGPVRKTKKMNNASCSKWQRWSAIRSNSSDKKSESSKGKGTIPYPIFIALILLAAIIKFVAENWVYVVSIGSIVICCVIACFLIYRKAKKPKIKMAFVILVGIISIITVISVVPKNKNINEQIEQDKSKEIAQQIDNPTNTNTQAETNIQTQGVIAEEQIGQEDRRGVENRSGTLQAAMIMDYKPCFNIGGSRNETPYEAYHKIAVVGYLENRYNSFGDEFIIKPINFNNNQRENLTLVSTTALTAISSLFQNTEKTGSSGSMNSYYCIFFLTKSNENGFSKYIVDSYIFLGDIIGKGIESTGRSDVKQASLEDWILNNDGKQSIQFLNVF